MNTVPGQITMFSGEAVPFVMELPNYRMPSARNVAQMLWEKAKDFLERAFTIIFLAIGIAGTLWVMHHMNTNMMPQHNMEHATPAINNEPGVPSP